MAQMWPKNLLQRPRASASDEPGSILAHQMLSSTTTGRVTN
jgi:hypothetical protein